VLPAPTRRQSLKNSIVLRRQAEKGLKQKGNRKGKAS
jgi:hypothetical protein